MDAVGLYLPSPHDRPRSALAKSFGDSLCARVFKVRHDEHMGAITFLRLYSGALTKVSLHLILYIFIMNANIMELFLIN